jgi:Phosphotransferase enzyme family
MERCHGLQACAELGFPDARVARDDIAFVRSQLDAPGPYAALVHNDLNPTNALVTDRGIRLVDFEGSGFGHIGFDASFLHYPWVREDARSWCGSSTRRQSDPPLVLPTGRRHDGALDRRHQTPTETVSRLRGPRLASRVPRSSSTAFERYVLEDAEHVDEYGVAVGVESRVGW